MSDMVILDVGHGNSAILRDGDQTAIVDAPIGVLLLHTLEDMSIDTVKFAFVSHADSDHLAGILSLLTSEKVRVERIFINPDAHKRSTLWRDFRAAVSVAERKGTCVITTSLSTTTAGKVAHSDIAIYAVAPAD